MRLPALQFWPWFMKMPNAAAGDDLVEVDVLEHDGRRLAPELQLDASAHLGAVAHDAMPVSVPPVNDTRSTSGCRAMAPPTTLPLPVTTLNTPGGRPGLERQLGDREGASGWSGWRAS